METANQASFFDVDNTLIRGDTQEMEGRLLMGETGLWSPRKILTGMGILAAMGAHRMGWISQARQNRVYLNFYRGRCREELNHLGEKIFDEQVRMRIFARAMALVASRREKGDLIVLVSATTSHLLRPLARHIGPDQVFCTHLAFDRQGRATGTPLGSVCIGAQKAKIVKDFAAARNLDLSRCHAYSDHHSDLPLLSCVGHPEVINPTPTLAAYAGKRGWPVHRFYS